MSAQSSTLAQRYRVWLTAAIVALITLVIFVPALDNEFVNWDDDLNFIYNLNYRGLGLEQLKWMFTTFHMGHYHPLTWITLGMDYCICQMNPWGYHLTNVVLHAATVAVFVFLALQLYRIV
ncbi:MAG: hypothetical protein JSV03_04375, partial [Planctomycetota bacterium]